MGDGGDGGDDGGGDGGGDGGIWPHVTTSSSSAASPLKSLPRRYSKAKLAELSWLTVAARHWSPWSPVMLQRV